MNCKYIYTGKQIKKDTYTLQQLKEVLDKLKSIGNEIDFIYSLDEKTLPLLAQKDLLEKIKKDNQYLGAKKSKISELVIDEDSYGDDLEKAMSLSYFIDYSGLAMINGVPILTPINIDNYKASQIKTLMDSGVSEADAIKQVEDDLKAKQSLVEISPFIHRLAISKYIGRGNPEEKQTYKEQFVKWAVNEIKDLPKILKAKRGDSYYILELLFDLLDLEYIRLKGPLVESKAVRGINIISKLKGSDLKLFAHIDYAIITEDGSLRIYNYKVSSLRKNDWSLEKKNKYRLEVALLVRMLLNNGVNINNIKVYNIPLYIEFSKNSDGSFNGNSIKFMLVPPVPTEIEVNSGSEYRQCSYNALYFIDPYKGIGNIRNNQLADADSLLESIFPTLLVSSFGIEPSTLDLISRAPQTGNDSLPLRIVEFPNNDDYRYIVYIFGLKHIIKSKVGKTRNTEIIELVLKNILSLNEEQEEHVSSVVDALKNIYAKKRPYLPLNIKNETYIRERLSKYFTGKTKEDGTVDYDWVMHDTLASYGILLFQKGDIIDVVSLTDRNLESMPKYNYGDNILGGYVFNDKFLWKGDYGNVEAVRALCLLNEITDALGPVKLGGLRILSRHQTSRDYHIQDLVESKFVPLIKTLKRYNPTVQVLNNLSSKVKYEDLLTSVFNEYDYILNDSDSYAKAVVENNIGNEINNLRALDLETREQKRAALLSLILKLENIDSISDVIKNIPENLKSLNSGNRAIAHLYDLISKAYLYYSNETLGYERKLSDLDKNMFTSFTIPNANIGLVVENLRITIDSIAEEVVKEHTDHLQGFIMEFLKAKGYTSFQNETLGNQTHLFDNLYELDDQGKKTMVFKNPYTDNSLDAAERKFLKHALYYFNKYRFKDNWTFKGVSVDDQKIADYIIKHKEYLWVPLERASKSTLRQLNRLEKWINKTKRFWKIIKDKERWMDEGVNALSKYERDNFYNLDESMETLKLRDPFDLTEQERNEYLASEKELGSDYFETNVASLLVDRMFRKIHVEKMNKMLIGTRAILTQLQIMGIEAGEKSKTKEWLKREIDYIKDYIKLNVFQGSIAGETSQKLMGAFGGIKRSSVLMLLGGNLIAGFRDVENGIMENFIRTASKYMTDISPKSLSLGYAFVIRNGAFDAMKTSLMSKLCLMYRLSNTDTARISERLKTNRQGLSNWDNLAYATLRAPDFLNRMTLFISRAILDGIIDPDHPENSAWYIEKIKDENGIEVETLKYDWKKDKRFSIYASGDKKHPLYLKQKQAFLEQIRKWNRDHPDMSQQIDINGENVNLPVPYSNQDIVTIKAVADNIYGAYDKSLKARYESLAAGWAFGMFTTWMNGMYNNWFMKPGQYNIFKMKELLALDENGNFLWMDEDGQIITEVTDKDGNKKYLKDDQTEVKPDNLKTVSEHVPVIAQGIIYTLKNAGILFSKLGFKKAKEYILSDELAKANLKLAAISLILAWLLAFLFMCLFSPAYKEHKKQNKGASILGNALIELSYRPFEASTDSLYGVFNLFLRLEDSSTPLIKVPKKLIETSYKTLMGEKSFDLFVSENFAFGRSFRDTLRMAK